LLLQYLTSKGHEIHFLANAYQGTTLKKATLKDGTEFNCHIYGMGKQPYFADIMSGHLKETNSDIFLILLDTFMLMQPGGNLPFGWFLNIDTSPSRTFFWYPSDGGGGMPLNCDAVLKKVDYPVAMAKYGQKQVKDYYNLDTHHIPHGTEPDRFYPLPDEQRKLARAKYGLNDKFVIGVVARNQPRKFLDRTIKAMKILNIVKDKIPNAVLFLHMDPNDMAQAFNMQNLIQKYNLENRVVFSGMSALKGFDWTQMNEVYNIMDVHLLTTSGEGFGIPTIEAMSCEVPALATNYTTTAELILENQAGLGIELVGNDKVNILAPTGIIDMDAKEYDELVCNGTITGSWEVERGICDIHDAANKLVYLYENPNEREKMGQNGRKAVLEKYDFNNVVGPAFEKMFVEAIK
jgi:glycosyltransferase involved in cell wall biosynthesis